MKNVIMGSVLAIAAVTSLSAQALTICAGGSAANGQQVPANTSGFVKVAFVPKCSANVFLDGVDQSSTIYAVASGSAKGKKIYSGSTAGGSIAPLAADCPTTGCTAGAVTTEAAAAAAAAAAS